MSDSCDTHKPAPLTWPFAVTRMIQAAAPPRPSPKPPKGPKRRWTFMGLK